MESVKGSAKVDGGCRFTDPAFLVGYREDASHGECVWGVFMKTSCVLKHLVIID